MDVTLVMFKADGTRRDFPLNKPRVIVGRKNACDLRIPLTSVSRQHCELLVEGDTVRVRDLGSSNGTYHNSNRVQEAELGPGDELTIGPVVFIVVIDGQPSQIKPVRTILGDASKDTIVSTTPGNLSDHSSVVAGDEPVELDEDDPLAALEALDKAEDEGGGSSLGEFEFLSDDDEEEKK